MLTLLVLLTASALPDLKIEAVDGGSALIVKNTHESHALTAYLVELVDYPGSSFAFSQDELARGGEPLAAGKERRIPIQNMTVGAAAGYVKMRAALFADGSTAGDAEKVAQLVARRKLLLSTVREIIAQAGNLKPLLDATPAPATKLKRAAPEVVDQVARRELLVEAAHLAATTSPEEVATKFRSREAALTAAGAAE